MAAVIDLDDHTNQLRIATLGSSREYRYFRFMSLYAHEIMNVLSSAAKNREELNDVLIYPIVYRHNKRTFLTTIEQARGGASRIDSLGTFVIEGSIEIGCLCCGSGKELDNGVWVDCRLCG